MNNSETQKINIRSEAILFAVDLHKVLVKPDLKTMLSLLLTHKYLFLSFFNFHIWYHIIKEGAIPEHIVDALVKKYHTKGLTKEFLIKVINSQSLITSTIEVFQKLKAQDYHIYLASNIWAGLFKDLMQKFPSLQNLFDGFYIPSKENNNIEKPDNRYYEGFRKYVATKGDGYKNIIFIDNNRENIRAAQREGFIAIIYKGAKNLVKDLKKLGFKNISSNE